MNIELGNPRQKWLTTDNAQLVHCMELTVSKGNEKGDALFWMNDGRLACRPPKNIPVSEIEDAIDRDRAAFLELLKETIDVSLVPTKELLDNRFRIVAGALELGGKPVNGIASWKLPPELDQKGRGHGWIEFDMVDGKVTPVEAAYADEIDDEPGGEPNHQAWEDFDEDGIYGRAMCIGERLRVAVDFDGKGNAVAPPNDIARVKLRIIDDIEETVTEREKRKEQSAAEIADSSTPADKDGIVVRLGDARVQEGNWGDDLRSCMMVDMSVDGTPTILAVWREDEELCLALPEGSEKSFDVESVRSAIGGEVSKKIAAKMDELIPMESLELKEDRLLQQALILAGTMELMQREGNKYSKDIPVFLELPPDANYLGKGHGWLEFGISDGAIELLDMAYSDNLVTSEVGCNGSLWHSVPETGMKNGDAAFIGGNLRLAVNFALGKGVTETHGLKEIQKVIEDQLEKVHRDRKKGVDRQDDQSAHGHSR